MWISEELLWISELWISIMYITRNLSNIFQHEYLKICRPFFLLQKTWWFGADGNRTENLSRPPCAGGDGFGTWTDSLHPRKMLRPPCLGCFEVGSGNFPTKIPREIEKISGEIFLPIWAAWLFINHLVEVLGWNPTLVIFRDFIFTMNTRIIPMNQPDQWFDQISGFSGIFEKNWPLQALRKTTGGWEQVGRQRSWWLRLQRWFSSSAAMNFHRPIESLGGKCSDTCWWQPEIRQKTSPVEGKVVEIYHDLQGF